MRYFCIMTGLRGCYMPDSAYVVAVKTRRELKETLAHEYAFQVDYDAPARKREIASVAAALWRRSWKTVLPTSEGYGIQVNPISRAEYLASRDADH